MRLLSHLPLPLPLPQLHSPHPLCPCGWMCACGIYCIYCAYTLYNYVYAPDPSSVGSAEGKVGVAQRIRQHWPHWNVNTEARKTAQSEIPPLSTMKI